MRTKIPVKIEPIVTFLDCGDFILKADWTIKEVSSHISAEQMVDIAEAVIKEIALRYNLRDRFVYIFRQLDNDKIVDAKDVEQLLTEAVMR